MSEEIQADVNVTNAPAPENAGFTVFDQDAREYVKEGRDGDDMNVLVSAAAGTGKTTLLVDRIVEKIKAMAANNCGDGDGDDGEPGEAGEKASSKHVDSFLVVTFTKAAAAELRSRIERKMKAEIAVLLSPAVNDKETAGKLAEEIYLLPKASIGTIDSFCLEVVKKNFTAVKSCTLDPSFTMDENAVKIIREEVIAGVLEEYYKEDLKGGTDGTLRNILVTCGSYRDDAGLVKIIKDICDFCDSLPDPKKWLLDISGRFDISSGTKDNEWYKEIKKLYTDALDEAAEHARAALRYRNENTGEFLGCSKKDLDDLADWFKAIEAKVTEEKERLLAERPGESPALFSAEKEPKVDKRSKDFGKDIDALNDCDDPALTGLYRLYAQKNNLLAFLKKSYEKIVGPFVPKDTTPAYREKLFIDGIRETGRYVSLLTEIAGEVYERTVKECAKRKVFSFSAVAHFALEILCGTDTGFGNDDPESLPSSDVALAYRKKYDEIYIDEYQDTNMLQEFILYTVSRVPSGNANNMVMVGDVKQSIYAFRRAKPKLMLEKTENFSEADKGGILKKLTNNFRSREDVINGVNEVFSSIMTKATTGIDYAGGGHSLVYGAGRKYVPVQESEDRYRGRCELIYNAAGKLENEALIVASKIRELMNNRFQVRVTEYDKDGNEIYTGRDLRYSDICIIAGRNASVNAVAEYLCDLGIPAETSGLSFYYQRSEIYDIINFVKIIDNPRNDIPLAAVLRSPFFGFDDNKLADIRAVTNGIGDDRKKDFEFWDRLVMFAEKDSGAAFAVKEINRLRDLSESTGVSSFVWHLINYNNYYARCDGESKGNLREFLEFAYPYDKGTGGGLYSFAAAMEKAVAMDDALYDSAKKKSYSIGLEAADKVKAMTVHKSKGLEFPVVIYVDTNHVKNARKETVYLDEEDGIGLSFSYEGPRVFKRLARTGPNVALGIRKKEEERKELQRLVYVALTRAKEKLIVVGSHRSKDSKRMCFPFSPVAPCIPPTTANLKVCQSPYELIWAGTTKTDSVWEKELYTADDIQKLTEEQKSGDPDGGNEGNGGEGGNGGNGGKGGEEAVPGGDVEDTPEPAVEKLARALETANAGAMPTKISVSALKRYAEEEGTEEGANAFSIEAKEFPKRFSEEEDPDEAASSGKRGGKSKRLYGAALGTLMHRVIKLMIYDRANWPEQEEPAVREYIGVFLQGLFEKNIIDDVEKDSVRTGMLVNFLMSKRASEVRIAEKLCCEVPFTFRTDISRYIGGPEKPAKEGKEETRSEDGASIKTSLKEGKIIALQGVVDLYYKIGKHVVVVDFKTDNLNAGETPGILEAYRLQVRCYMDALEEISKEKPKEGVLFFLRTGEEIIC